MTGAASGAPLRRVADRHPLARDDLPIRLDRGTTVAVLRWATPADVPALRDLYGRLGPTDRYRRFFSGGLPSTSTLERWVTGDGNLVVVVEDDGRIVADAGVARSSGRRYELGLAVDPDRRGWLGPYLLDLVLRLAGDAGADAVVADVLATNGPMLGLLASRGVAVAPSGDPAVVRLLLGTASVVPGWDTSPDDRPRVLLELGTGGGAAAAALEQAGYAVVSCRGPAAMARSARHWRCPVLDGEECPLVNGADVVVAPADSRDRPAAEAAVLEDLPRLHPHVLVVRPAARSTPAAIVQAVESSSGDAGMDLGP